jgi:hypothetical protein
MHGETVKFENTSVVFDCNTFVWKKVEELKKTLQYELTL